MECIHKICALIGFEGHNKEPICLGDLHGVLFVGNTSEDVFIENGGVHRGQFWNIEKAYTMFSEHTIGLCTEELDELDDIIDSGDEDYARERFNELFRETILDKLL